MSSKAIACAILIAALPAGALAKPKETVLHSFGGEGDGVHPRSGFVVDGQGTMYGTTLHGGPTQLGTVYSLTAAGKYKLLYNFQGAAKGAFPFAGVILDRKGDLYGTTQGADIGSDFGTVFRMSTKGKNEKEVYVFGGTPDGGWPQSELLEVGNGVFYGTASIGGAGAGTVFKVTRSGEYEVVYTFLGGVDGANPPASLITDGNGDFISTTYNGGAHGWGTVFSVSESGDQHVLYSFTGGADGRNPSSGVTADKLGNIYGTTYFGGDDDKGVVFKLDSDGNESVLHSFTGGNDGANPLGDLLVDKKGNIYGTASQGGISANGTVFRITSAGAFKVLYRFTGNLNGGADGANPSGNLYLDAEGTLYSTTQNGGEHASGTIFKLTTK